MKIYTCALPFEWQAVVDLVLQSLIDSCGDKTEGVQLCADAACVLLELIKVILTKVSVSMTFYLVYLVFFAFPDVARYIQLQACRPTHVSG